MLALINNVWEGGCLPKEWKHAVIIPIVKPESKRIALVPIDQLP